MFSDERLHDLLAFLVVQIDYLHAARAHIFLGSLERSILTNHYDGYLIEQRGARTHIARRQCAVEYAVLVILL